MTPPYLEELLDRACNSDGEALGQLFEHYRDLLRAAAQQELSSRIQVRMDPSDVVQATFLEAHRDLSDFRGSEAGQFVAWLKQILQHNIQQTVEMHRLAQKRSVDREKPLDDSGGCGGRLRNALTADDSTPSQRVQREEKAQRLAAAITVLPADQQEATRLRYLEGMSLQQISERLGRPRTAVAGLLKRALQKLRQEFSDELLENLP
jgi:RNA polymerase sigma-70 factor (ECF subfamily)